MGLPWWFWQGQVKSSQVAFNEPMSIAQVLQKNIYSMSGWMSVAFVYCVETATVTMECIYPSFGIVPFQWSWMTSNAEFKVTPLFDVEYLRNGPRYWHGCNGILIGAYEGRTEGVRMTLSNLAKYSVTRSIARPLCDSWAPMSFSDQSHISLILLEKLQGTLSDAL